jgi:aryl-alcohol dehydrogenase-like predicted oxidoreductase
MRYRGDGYCFIRSTAMLISWSPEVLVCIKLSMNTSSIPDTRSHVVLTGAMTKECVAEMPQDDFRRNSKQFQEPLISRNLELVELLRTIGKRRDVEPGVVAIAWTLHNPAITAAIVGGRSAEQVDGVLPSATFRLSKEEFQEIGKFLSERV